MSIFRRPLDLGLVALFVVSAAWVLVAHEGPFAKVIYDLAIASMVSLIFYGLVVRLPDYQRRRRIKRSFLGRYQRFKEDCIGVMLLVADGSYVVV